MRFLAIAAACVLAAAPPVSRAQSSAGTPAALTLAEAMRLAETASPAVKARSAQRAAVEGTRSEAESLLFNNPSLSLERSRTRVSPAQSPEVGYHGGTVGLAQPFEIGGQRSHRREVAAASMEALEAEIQDARRQARGEAALRFHAVLAAQRRVAIEQRAVALFDGTATAVEQRRSAGEDTRLDANVALVEAARARNALTRTREQLLDALAELATALQWPPATIPEVAGALDLPASEPSADGLDTLLASVMSHPRVRASAARVAAARARLGLEQANRVPDITVGMNVERDGPGEARERITTLSVSLPLPLFRRNDAAIGQAASEAAQAEVEHASAMRDVQAQVRRLWHRVASQSERVQRLQRTALAASAQNQQLAARSRQAGQIGLLDQLVVARQALDAERELTDALADYHTTRIELEQAAGRLPEGSSR